MLAMGIDTSSGAGSIGIADDGRLLAELNLRTSVTHSQRLLPAIRSLLQILGLGPHQMDLFAVAAGPGSFTGLRIGMATAKGLSIATGRPLVGFSTLETIALACATWKTGGPDLPICVMLDAGRGEIYRGLYRCSDGEATPLTPEAVMPPERATAQLPNPCLVCVDGLIAYRDSLAHLLDSGRMLVEATPFIGGILAKRALRLAARQGLSGLQPLAPNYLRPSDAERTLES